MAVRQRERGSAVAEPAAAEPAAAEPAVDEQTLGNEEKRYLIAKYPEASDLLNLFATGGPGKRIFTEEELYFYNGAIKIYTQNTVSALDLLFPIKVSEYGVMRGERPTINIIGNVDSIPDIPFYNHRKQRGDNVEGIIEKLVNVIRMPPYGTILLKDLNEAAEILINGVKRKNGKREGILDDYDVFNLIKEKIKVEIPDDARRREIIKKIDNAMDSAYEMSAKLQEYASSREPWSTELHGFKWVGGKPNPPSIPDLPFDLGGKFQPPEPQSLMRHSPATTSDTHRPQVVRMVGHALEAGTGNQGEGAQGAQPSSFENEWEILRSSTGGTHGESQMSVHPSGDTAQPATNFDRQLEPEPELETQGPGWHSGLSSVTDVFSGIKNKVSDATSGAMAKIGQARDAILGGPETGTEQSQSGPDIEAGGEPAVEEKGDTQCEGDWDCPPRAPICGVGGYCTTGDPKKVRLAAGLAKLDAAIDAAGGGKRKRKYKRTRKTHKRSKHKKSHKRKKTLKRKYKNKSKRR